MSTDQPTNTELNNSMSVEKIIVGIILLVVIAAVSIRAMTSTDMHRSAYVTTTSQGTTVAAEPVDRNAGLAHFSVERSVGIWLAAFFTLAIFSFLYKDNPFYKTSEAIFVGVSAAYWMVVAFWTTFIPNLFGKLFPSWIQSWAIPGLEPAQEPFWWLYFVPLVLGIMLLMRLSPKGAWISLWPLAFIIGTTAGLRLIVNLNSDFLRQIQSTIIPPVVFESGVFQLDDSIKNTVVIVGLLLCLVYFFFSIEHKGAVGQIARGGIWVLMITFGAAFGYTVMGRIALLAIRFEFLMGDWLGLLPIGTL